jgi:uncharacterized protein
VNISEQTLSFICDGDPLVGVACIPEEPRSTGVVVIVGGPQYRVGSHRQFLLLSRTLASSGYTVMRFDYRGMGDGYGDIRNFENINDDIAAAINEFVALYPYLTRVVLWGLCDAASASLLYWDERRDQRVVGLCLLNPWLRSNASLAKTHMKHYYGQRLLQREFWEKLFTGKTKVAAALQGLVSSWRESRQVVNAKDRIAKSEAFQGRMARALKEFNGRVMLILSGNDYTAKEFLEYTADDPQWTEVFKESSMARITIPEADHTFSSTAWRADVANATLNWLMGFDLVENHTLVASADSLKGCR